ncbi:DUF3089 domain-containing protein [Iamia sp. SCSIO 61187]|uniref:DUF3089 domain-containing protein n=1 Tax=Iamia sp. SCSIO 61187 TaxID=2722752 RepID=UPI001C62CEAD|nr:DUF3089 domain-containing protein [Iamia sp. SCSIO 61187]QYG93755.1 DUF3089 domain-containing protein [Iamia sp. SCSIO 61187]
MRPRLRSIAALAVLAVLVAGCSDDDGGPEASSPEPTDTSAPEPTEGSGSDTTAATDEAVDDGYTSDVYDDDARWICRPDLADDVCRNLDVTVVGADGSRTVEEREPAADPPIDCFYVYPTVSLDPGPVSDLEWTPQDNEALTVVAQAAQYGRSCRVFAPVYRQISLTGLGSADEAQREAAYADVLDAWRTYLARWNQGRGVILVGHSQGTGHLVRLIAEEVDGVPAVQDLLVAAHLFGGSVTAPEGEIVGGSFQDVPACTTADEAGCVVTWSSYPATAPPDESGIFGRAGEDGRALCVDPTALLGTDRSRAVAPVAAPLIGGAVPGTEGVETPFVALPDALAVTCEATETHDYLAVAAADPADARPLDALLAETLGPSWGLHLVDMTVALDDLVELARRQGEAHGG